MVRVEYFTAGPPVELHGPLCSKTGWPRVIFLSRPALREIHAAS